MNSLFMKVLNEILLGIHITEPNSIRNKQRRRRSRRRTMASDQVLGHNRVRKLEGEEKKIENIAGKKNLRKEEKKEQCKARHEHMTCKKKLQYG